MAKSSDGSIQYGLFTNRTFKVGDILGVYLGDIASITADESWIPLPTHQFKNFDAKDGKRMSTLSIWVYISLMIPIIMSPATSI